MKTVTRDQSGGKQFKRLIKREFNLNQAPQGQLQWEGNEDEKKNAPKTKNTKMVMQNNEWEANHWVSQRLTATPYITNLLDFE